MHCQLYRKVDKEEQTYNVGEGGESKRDTEYTYELVCEASVNPQWTSML